MYRQIGFSIPVPGQKAAGEAPRLLLLLEQNRHKREPKPQAQRTKQPRILAGEGSVRHFLEKAHIAKVAHGAQQKDGGAGDAATLDQGRRDQWRKVAAFGKQQIVDEQQQACYCERSRFSRAKQGAGTVRGYRNGDKAPQLPPTAQ